MSHAFQGNSLGRGPAPRVSVSRAAARRNWTPWPSRRRRVLNRVKKQLLTEDPRLYSMFAFFTKLTREDAIPPAERIETGPRRLLRVALAGRRRHLLDQACTEGKRRGQRDQIREQ